jgi:hypothetical protein
MKAGTSVFEGTAKLVSCNRAIVYRKRVIVAAVVCQGSVVFQEFEGMGSYGVKVQ